MNYRLSKEERDTFIQIVSSENFALARGTSEDYLNSMREKMDYIRILKNKYRIPDDSGINIILDTGILTSYD